MQTINSKEVRKKEEAHLLGQMKENIKNNENVLTTHVHYFVCILTFISFSLIYNIKFNKIKFT